MTKPTCPMPDCERAVSSRGLCHRHYTRLRKHGDPSVDMHRSSRDSMGLKICKSCREPLEDSSYHRDSGTPDGLRAQCKGCRAKYMVGYHAENVERINSYQRSRRLTHTEHVRALDMARYERDKNSRIALASDSVRRRRARQAGAENERGVTVARLREMHGDACCYCGVEMDFVRGARGSGIARNRATLEHVLPVSRGGSHTFRNTLLACHRCNVSKNDKTLEEYEEWKAAGLHGREEATASRSSG